MTVFTKIKFRYKLLFLLSLYFFTAFSQNNKHTRFRDYPFVQNLDSFERVIRTRKNNSEQYLHDLITLEKNRIEYLGWFGQDLSTIKTLAYQLRLPLAIASYHYLEGIHIREQSLGNASRNILEAIRYFEATKDTMGMISCYYSMLINNSNLGVYRINKVESPQYYYDKIINLGQKSSRINDKLARIRTILTFEKSVKGKQDFIKGLKDVEEALVLIKSETGPVNPSIYVAFSSFYSRHNKLQQVLEYDSKVLELHKNRTSKTPIRFYYNFAITCFNTKAYKESEFYAIEVINSMEKLKEEERDNKILLNAYNVLSEIQYIKKDYESAKASQEKAFGISIKRYALLKSSLFEELKTQHETEQKEIENVLLTKKNELAEIKNQKLQQENEISLLFQKNKLAESQNLEYQKEIENNLLNQKNQAIESSNAQYKTAFGIGSVSFIIVCILVYFLNRANNKQKKVILFRDQLFAIIAHDLRRPFIAFHGMSELVGYYIKKGDYSAIQKISQSIDDSGLRIRQLLDNLLKWALSEKEEVLYEPKRTNLLSEIQSVVQIYESAYTYQALKFDIRCPEDLIVFVDQNALQLILRNLISNALSAIHIDKGLIGITASINADKVMLSVKDNGRGLDEAKIASIRQVLANPNTWKAGENGLGFGLILISKFTKRNNIYVNVKSKLGEGTCFELLLPTI